MIEIRLDSGWLRTELVIKKLASIQHTIQFQRAMKVIAQDLRSKVLEQIRSRGSGDWAKLSRWTLATRRFRGFGGSRPLMRTGDLRSGIVARTEFSALDSELFVGVLAGSTTEDGADLVDIARINEFGITPFKIKVTPKSRKLIGAISMYLRGKPKTKPGTTKGRDYIITSIPSRPIFQPVADRELDGVLNQIIKVVMNAFS